MRTTPRPCGKSSLCPKRPPRAALALSLLALTMTIPAALAAGAVRISHYERLQSVEVDSHSPAGIADVNGAPATKTVTIKTTGRVFVLDLVRNDRLVAGLRSRMSLDDEQLTVYKGSMRAVPGSWARVSISDGRVSGVIWDGGELLLVEELRRLEGVQGVAHSEGGMAVVRLADIELPIDRGIHPAAKSASQSAAKVLAETVTLAKSAVASGKLTSRAMSLGIVIDTALVKSIYNAEQAAIEWANIADGIFTEQVALHIDLEHILNLDGGPDPFNSTDHNQLLATLADLKSANADLAPLGLAHLLTRIDLDGDTRGAALLASSCGPSTGVGLTEARGSIIDALIMTHELAHNLGAPHDNEDGSVCASTPGNFLMSPTLNGSSTFSTCSVNQMSAYLNTVSCLVSVAGSELELETPILPAQIYYKESLDLGLHVHNTGSESVVDSRLDIASNGQIDILLESASDRECMDFSWKTQQTCDLDNLYAGETITVSTLISPNAIGPQVLDIVASAANDINPDNNAVSLAIDVLAATEVRADGSNTTHIATWQGGTVSYSMTVTNRGDFDSTAAVLFQTDPRHTLSGTGNCTLPAAGQLNCNVGLLPAGADSTFEFSVQADPNFGLGLADSSIEYIEAILETSLHNTAQFPDSRFMFVVYGAFFDVEVEFTKTPVSIDVNESSEFSGTVTNFGPDPVPNLEFRASVASGVTLGAPTADRGVCTTDGQVVRCRLGQFDPGESVAITYPYTGVTPGRYQIHLFPEFGGGFEVSPTYPSAGATFDVVDPTPPPAPPPPAPQVERGGGGGQVSPAWLLVLLACSLRRRQSKPSESVRYPG